MASVVLGVIGGVGALMIGPLSVTGPLSVRRKSGATSMLKSVPRWAGSAKRSSAQIRFRGVLQETREVVVRVSDRDRTFADC